MSLTDEQIELHALNDEPEDWNDLGHRKTWRQGYVIGYKAAESEATAPLLEKIAELERELEALRKDAGRLDWLVIHGSFGVDSVTGQVGGNGQKRVVATRAAIDAKLSGPL